MKNKLIVSLLLLTVMISSPLLAIDKTTIYSQKEKAKISSDENGYISVMLNDNGKMEKVSEKEYILSSLAAEMDVNSPDEALKAQAIACRTFLLYKKQSTSNEKFDISDDYNKGQGYCNKEERKKSWKDKYDQNEKRLESIVDSVSNLAITYKDELIKPLYFNCSSGVTQSSKKVFNEDLPYLQSVNSIGDKLSVTYSDSIKISDNDFKKAFDGFNLKMKSDDWMGDTERDKDGYVNNITVCDKKITGTEFRNKLNLKSCVFYISHEGNNFNIITFGSGHQVGMSQTGAVYMAEQGADYNEILKHYYTGVEIKKWEQSILLLPKVLFNYFS